MAIKDYSEKEIRKKILSKIDPDIDKNGKHWKGKIYIKDKLVTKVKIPNHHNRIMHKNKSKYIARDLKLSDKDFNDLIDCPLTSEKYYEKLEEEV